MSHILHSQSDLDAAIAKLVLADPRLSAVLAKAGRPGLRRREPGFAGLCAIVVAQQLSTASAGAIWGRMQTAFDPFHHDSVRRARKDKLVRIGLSAPKIRTMKAIGTAVSRGDINLERLAHMEADAAHAALTALHGIGPWTADIYLLFCLGHADAWPAGDLALQEAARVAFGLRARPDAKRMQKLADLWRPWRGVAAHLLWNYYRAIKHRDPVPVQPAPSSEQEGKADGRARRPAARTKKR